MQLEGKQNFKENKAIYLNGGEYFQVSTVALKNTSKKI